MNQPSNSPPFRRPDLTRRESLIAYIETVSEVMSRQAMGDPAIFSMALLELRWANEMLAALNLKALTEDNPDGICLHVSRERRLSSRFSTGRSVSVLLGSRKMAGNLIDISQTGARLEISKGVPIGSRVKLALADEKNVFANVVWSRDECIGMTFNNAAGSLKLISRYIVETAF